MINTLATPKIMYNCLLLSVPEYVIVKVEQLVSHFLWYGKSRINRNCVIASTENGGLNIMDIRSKIKSLKAGWIIRWMKNAIWSPLAESYLNKIGGNFKLFLQMNVSRVSDLPLLNAIPKCYQDIWLSFYESKPEVQIMQLSNHNFLTSSIWGNKKFKFKNRCLFFRNWIESGIIFIKDLYDVNGDFIEEATLFNKLVNKTNWISEYTIVKKVTKQHKGSFSTKQAKFINTENIYQKQCLINDKSIHGVKVSNTKRLYKILINAKSTRHFMEKVWSLKFKTNITIQEWSQIYSRKVLSGSRFSAIVKLHKIS